MLAQKLNLTWVKFKMESTFVIDMVMVNTKSTQVSFIQTLLQTNVELSSWRTLTYHIISYLKRSKQM